MANFTVKDITAVLKKSYGESTYDSVEIKPEPIFHTGACKVINDQKTEGHQYINDISDEGEDTYYASTNWKNKKKYKPNNSKTMNCTYQFSMKQPTKRGKNPLDKQGNITQCYNCYSINHWAENCPDKSTE